MRSIRQILEKLSLPALLVGTSLPILFLGFFLYRQSVENERRLLELDTRLVSRSLIRRIESFSRNRVVSLRLTEAFYESSDQVSDREFANFIGTVMASHKEFHCMAMVGPDGIIQKIYPSSHREEAAEQLKRPEVESQVKWVQRHGKMRIVSWSPLLVKEWGIAFYCPILKNNQVLGVIIGSIPLPQGLENVFGEEVRKYWSYWIYDERGRLLYSSEENSASRNPAKGRDEIPSVSESFAFGELNWRIVLRPKYDLDAIMETWTPEKMILFGAVSAAMVMCCVYGLYERQRRLKLALEDTCRAHALAMESEKRFREVMERVSLLILVLDREGKIRFCNDRFLQATGYSREEAIGRDLFGLCVASKDRNLYRRLFQRVLLHGQFNTSGHYNVVTKTGAARHISCRHVVSYDERGEIDAVTIMGDDITERLANEESLRQSQKLESLGILAGGIAHDFNNLLTTIIGHNDLAIKKAGASSPLQPHLNAIASTSKRLADLTAQMLAYSGRGHFEVSDVDINTVLREMAELLRISVPRRVEIYYDLRDHLPLLRADSAQIEQVLFNLVANAAESIHDRPGKIVLKTRLTDLQVAEIDRKFSGYQIRPGRFIELSVSDNGSGIEPEKLKYIFDPFFTTKFTGRGLGLAVLQGIVRGHGGAVSVNSSVGVGTTFGVYFPAEEILEQKISNPNAKTEAPADRKKSNETILVVDDEEAVRELSAEILQMAGFQVLTAPDGEAGVKIFEAEHANIAAVLLDLTMPGMGGQAACSRLHEIDPTVRVVLTSGYSNAQIELQFKEGYLAGFLKKPFLPSELLKWIFEAVEPEKTSAGRPTS